MYFCSRFRLFQFLKLCVSVQCIENGSFIYSAGIIVHVRGEVRHAQYDDAQCAITDAKAGWYVLLKSKYKECRSFSNRCSIALSEIICYISDVANRLTSSLARYVSECAFFYLVTYYMLVVFCYVYTPMLLVIHAFEYCNLVRKMLDGVCQTWQLIEHPSASPS